MGCKFFEIIYNFGRGLATSLPLLLVKQVVTPPSGEKMVYQYLGMECMEIFSTTLSVSSESLALLPHDFQERPYIFL